MNAYPDVKPQLTKRLNLEGMAQATLGRNRLGLRRDRDHSGQRLWSDGNKRPMSLLTQ